MRSVHFKATINDALITFKALEQSESVPAHYVNSILHRSFNKLELPLGASKEHSYMVVVAIKEHPLHLRCELSTLKQYDIASVGNFPKILFKNSCLLPESSLLWIDKGFYAVT